MSNHISPTPPPAPSSHSHQTYTSSLPLSPASAAASVRRVHTISSSTSRSRSRIAEEREGWENVEGVEEEYAYEGGVGPGPYGEEVWQENLGWEGDGLQRHNSMPSRYSRAFMSRYNQPSPPPTGGQLRMKNSLQQIQAEAEEQEQGEEDWEREMRGLHSGGEGASLDPALSPTDTLQTPTTGPAHGHTHSRSHSQSSTSSPLSPFLPSLYPGPSLPKQGYDDLTSDMRRAHSLTYGQHRISERLARSPALRNYGQQRGHTHSASIGSNSSGGGAVEGAAAGGAEQLSPPTSPVRASPWATPPPTSTSQQQQQHDTSGGVKDPSWEARLEQVQRTIAQFALDGAAHMTPNPSAPGSSGTSTPAFSAPRFAQAAAGSSASSVAGGGARATTPASPPPAGQPWSPQPQLQNRPALNLVTTSASPPPPKGPTSSQAAFPPLGHGQHTNPYLPAQYAHTPLALPGTGGMQLGLGVPGAPGMGMGGMPGLNLGGMNMLGAAGMMQGLPAPPPLPAGYSGKHVHRPSSGSTESATGTGASAPPANAASSAAGLAPPEQGQADRTPTQGDFDRLNAAGADLKRTQAIRGFSSQGRQLHAQAQAELQAQEQLQSQQLQQQASQQQQIPQQGSYVPQQSVGMTLGEALGGGMGMGDGLTSPIDVPALIAAKGYNPPTFDTQPPFARYFVIKSYTEDDVHKSLKYEIWSSTEPGNKRLDRAFKESAGRGPIYLFFSVNASGHFCGVAEMLTPLDYTRSSTVWAQDKWKGVFKVRWIFVRDVPNSVLRHIKLNNTQEKKPVTNSRDTQELLPDAGQEMLRIFLTHPARTSLLQDFIYYEQQAQLRNAQGTPQSQGNAMSPQPKHLPHMQQQPLAQAAFQPPVLPFAQPGQRATPPLQMPIQQPFPSFAPHGLGMQPPQPPFAMPAHAQLARTPSPQYEQTLQGILRRSQGQSPNPQQAPLGGAPVQLPSGATGTPFIPSAVGMRGF